MQKGWSIDKMALHTSTARLIGWLLIALSFLLAFVAIRQFVVSKNAIVTIKAATSLQTGGIYGITRNPMYLSLVLFYSGIGIFFGNWWTFLFFPFLIAVVRWYVIRKEEHYLQNNFGTDYEAYRKKVRRWI
jgi:protein-S-isoprenylcysteine O-methyltransferase Ste14